MSNLQMKRLWRKKSHHRLHRVHKIYAWKTFVWFTEHGYMTYILMWLEQERFTGNTQLQPLRTNQKSVISTYEIARTYLEDKKHVKYSSDLKNLISLIEKPTAWIDISTKLKELTILKIKFQNFRIDYFLQLKIFQQIHQLRVQ